MKTPILAINGKAGVGKDEVASTIGRILGNTGAMEFLKALRPDMHGPLPSLYGRWELHHERLVDWLQCLRADQRLSVEEMSLE